MGLLSFVGKAIGTAAKAVGSFINNAKVGKAAKAAGFVAGQVTVTPTTVGATVNNSSTEPFYKQTWFVPVVSGVGILLTILTLALSLGKRR